MLKARFVVLDTETSGIEEADGIMLEIHAAALDENLEEVGNFNSHIKMPGEAYGDETKEKYFNDFTWEMHTKNGLLDELRNLNSDKADPGTVAKDFAEWASVIKENSGHDAEAEGYEIPLVLVGNNPESFDRRWLSYHMPAAAKVFHYRPLNVSSVRWVMSIALGVDAREIKKELGFGGHRAKDDVQSCIDELKFYARSLKVGTEMFAMEMLKRLHAEQEEEKKA
jgi:oligoribonuclease (3'-5' exoribonuclease)